MLYDLYQADLRADSGMLSVSIQLIAADDNTAAPRLTLLFRCGDHTRRFPLVCENSPITEGKAFWYNARILLSEVFYHYKASDTSLKILYEDGMPLSRYCAKRALSLNEEDGLKVQDGEVIISADAMNCKARHSCLDLLNKETLIRLVFSFFNVYYRFYRKRHPVKKNRITFMSGRRTSLDGNMKFVYDELESRGNLDLQTLLFRQSSGKALLKNALPFLKLYATSAAVVVDDYFRLLNYFEKPKGTKIYQLWHACGAFKTFGYSRLGKPGAPSQREPNHRMYDYTFVSSKEVARHYAEGFGISDACVISSGVPRCDVFFDENYKAATKERLYRDYPQLKNKKVLLFAPTFRGNGQQSAYYPTDRLEVNRLARDLGGDWAVIIKLHPFCKERFELDRALSDRVIDLSDSSELNDLLFITDLLVTDYSSAVFEASLLDIPMLFYAFDLEEYIGSRDFYYRFEALAPGKTVTTQEALTESIQSGDFEKEKIAPFRERFFDYTDSGSAQRAADHIIRHLGE